MTRFAFSSAYCEKKESVKKTLKSRMSSFPTRSVGEGFLQVVRQGMVGQARGGANIVCQSWCRTRTSGCKRRKGKVGGDITRFGLEMMVSQGGARLGYVQLLVSHDDDNTVFLCDT